MYVGKAKNLKQRVSSYFTSLDQLAPKTAQLVSQIAKIKITRVESEVEALLLEASLIKKFTPKYNIRLTDGKAYPLIRVTIKSLFPAVVVARRIEDKNSVYFGPFPSASSVRIVLRTLRHIFPYHSTLNHPKKVCLYYHLGLCPCVPAHNTPQANSDYKKIVAHIIDFLDGNAKKVLKDLQSERETLSNNEQFEKAQIIQEQLQAIEQVTNPVHAPFEYETNPNLKVDLRMKELVSLREILKQHDVHINLPNRIECFDNSNFQGTSPTASMVVLTHGEIDKSQYRKFKIKTVKGPNDFASMQEIFRRRLKHTEWPYPDIFIVDGGKGQISSAGEVLDQLGVQIPLVGLAKRDEIIITRDFREIRLRKSDPALQLVMRIRDEAHRFAITFHRKLRSKHTFE